MDKDGIRLPSPPSSDPPLVVSGDERIVVAALVDEAHGLLRAASQRWPGLYESFNWLARTADSLSELAQMQRTAIIGKEQIPRSHYVSHWHSQGGAHSAEPIRDDRAALLLITAASKMLVLAKRLSDQHSGETSQTLGSRLQVLTACLAIDYLGKHEHIDLDDDLLDSLRERACLREKGLLCAYAYAYGMLSAADARGLTWKAAGLEAYQDAEAAYEGLLDFSAWLYKTDELRPLLLNVRDDGRHDFAALKKSAFGIGEARNATKSADLLIERLRYWYGANMHAKDSSQE